MKIGLYDIDGKIPNLALMKISAWHKKQGDETELFFPLKSKLYDKVYASQIFTQSEPVYRYNELGGPGTKDWSKILSDEVEHVYPDYSLYNYEQAMGFTTRGCIRNCPFCIVRQKEGRIRENTDIYEFWKGQKELILLDNNILALPNHFKKIANQIIKEKIKVDFCQGLDVRLINEENANLLAKIRHLKNIHFAFDWIQIENQVKKGIKILNKAGIKSYNLMFYVLIGYNSTEEEDLYRVELLRSLGAKPFTMPFNKNDRYQKNFARWVNHKAIFESVKWKDYKKT